MFRTHHSSAVIAGKFKRASLPIMLLALIGLGACTTIAPGPSVTAMPGTGKSFDQFRADDGMCRQYALQQGGGMSADQAAVDSSVRSAALGTVIGAVAGAAINGSRGAGVGAGTGLLFGTMAGANAADRTGHDSQRRYDAGYSQCMYAQGHRVPVNGRFAPEAPPPSAGGPGSRPPSGGPGAAYYPPPPPPSYR
ncbi:hypothetical protein BH11PSE11_BH11PSE11_23000 [soil metagenome]